MAAMNSPTHLPTVVAITAASSSILGFEMIKALLLLDQPVECIISTHSYQVIQEEMKLNLTTGSEQEKAILHSLNLDTDRYRPLLQCHNNKNIGAPPASGTHLTRGMVIIPCSMGTLGKITAGISDNLITRSADVILKERRPLILVPRESPLNQIHLQNMLTLTQAGALIMPPVLSFYQEAFHSIQGQINYTIGKVLDHLGLTHHHLFPRWGM